MGFFMGMVKLPIISSSKVREGVGMKAVLVSSSGLTVASVKCHPGLAVGLDRPVFGKIIVHTTKYLLTRLPASEPFSEMLPCAL